MKYYYYDLCAGPGDIVLYEYKSKEEFKDGMLWNRDIAIEYGDKVKQKKIVMDALNKDKEFDFEFNGAIFIACNDIKTYEGGAYAN